MTANIEIRGSTIALHGDLSTGTAAGLHRDTPVFELPQYEVDLQGVERCDSAGLALLVYWATSAIKSSSRLKFLNVPESLMEIARLGGLDGLVGGESVND